MTKNKAFQTFILSKTRVYDERHVRKEKKTKVILFLLSYFYVTYLICRGRTCPHGLWFIMAKQQTNVNNKNIEYNVTCCSRRI